MKDSLHEVQGRTPGSESFIHYIRNYFNLFEEDDGVEKESFLEFFWLIKLELQLYWILVGFENFSPNNSIILELFLEIRSKASLNTR